MWKIIVAGVYYTLNMKGRFLAISEISIIVVLAIVPLFVTFPYRVNIFLSWEGAYRMSEGQLPFRDFGTPLGGMFWVIPAIFFKLFGCQLITLVKAQVFINIIAGLSFRSILKHCRVPAGISLVAVVLFCLSYSFFNFWPWYNHTVIVYQLVALAFLFQYMNATGTYRIWRLAASALFVCFSFLTKQDGGGMAFMICLALLAYYCYTEKKWMPLAAFVVFFATALTAIIIPFAQYQFGYWFNHGQPPHTARVSVSEIISEFLYGSYFIKFYIFLVILLLFARYKKWSELWTNRTDMLFLLLTLAILGEAAVFQVTSYTPPDNNIFFHSFAVAFILVMLSKIAVVNFERPVIIVASLAGMLLWWSSVYWKYIQRIADRMAPRANVAVTVSPAGENLVNRNTYMISTHPLHDIPVEQWQFSGLKAFHRIFMPQPTIDGMHRLLAMDLVKKGKNLKVLNMSELTPLAAEIPYEPERNPHLPLWYHLGVGMFNRQAALFEQRIQQHHYDLVLFEYIPSLNNFYPFRVRDSLKVHYKMVDAFPAPRRGETQGQIEVYVKP